MTVKFDLTEQEMNTLKAIIANNSIGTEGFIGELLYKVANNVCKNDIDTTPKLTPEMILDALKKLEFLERKDTIVCHTKWYDQVKKIINDNGLQDRCSVKTDNNCCEDKFFIVNSEEVDNIKFVEHIPVIENEFRCNEYGYIMS